MFFDNLQVSHVRGPLTEEDHYYPFGLTMAGASDKAIKSQYAENKYRFTGQLYDDDLNWDTYQMKHRTIDPQLGRFCQVDPIAGQYPNNSPFAYAENEVTRSIDLEGLEKYIVTKDVCKHSVFGQPYEKKHITRVVDSKGDLKDQNLRDQKTGSRVTNSAVYTFDNINNKNDKGSDKLSNADQFIAEEGIRDVDKTPGTLFSIETKGSSIAETSPTQKGDKMITSEGLTTDYTMADVKNTNVPAQLTLQIKSIENAIKDNNAQIHIFITANLSTTMPSGLLDITKNRKNVVITLINSNKQGKNTAHVTVAAVSNK